MASSLYYTSFPDLNSTFRTTPQTLSLSAYQNLILPRHQIIKAWARLLRAYTLEQEPIFHVDDEPVVVSLAQSESISVLETLPLTSGITTNIVFGSKVRDLDETPRTITLLHSQDTGDGLLSTHSTLSRDSLTQVASQLRQILKTVANADTGAPEDDSLSLSVLNAAPAAENAPRALHQLLDCHRDMEAIALTHMDGNGTVRNVSYRQLHASSDALARHLATASRFKAVLEKKSPVIPVMIPQSPELYITLLAVLKAGAAFCPLHLDAPAERIKFVLQDTSSDVLLVTQDALEKLPSDLKHCMFDVTSIPQRDAPTSFVASAPTLCYVMYTSGSTGQPKGVALSHSAVTQSLSAHDRHIPQYARFLQFAAPTFDVSMFEIFFTLFRGATLVSCDRKHLLSDLSGVIGKLQVDGVELTPTVTSSLLQNRRNVPDLRLLLTIGEMLSRNVIEEFGGSEDRPGILYAMYGPTEAAIHCTLQPGITSDSKVGNIGIPLDTVSTFVIALDAKDAMIVPVGQIGELALGGHQLAEEYLNRPDQSRSAFIEHPTHGRLYRTGDKARQLPDGSLECLGRVSAGQVKLRGQRMELGEVEAAALQNSGVTNAMASVMRDQLVLFCLTSNATISENTVIEACRSWLPGFMVPNDVRLVADWPQLPSGKVDRNQLEQDYLDAIHTKGVDQTQPSTDEETNVYNAVATLLGRNVGMHTELSKVGLDSLRAIRLSSALREHGISLGAADIFAAGTIHGICSVMNARSPERDDELQKWYDRLAGEVRNASLKSQHLMERSDNVQDVFPCSPLQCSMLAETARNPTAYWNTVVVDIDLDSFEDVTRLFSEVAAHNEILRSGFQSTESAQAPYAQIVWKELAPWQMAEAADNHKPNLLYPLRIQTERLQSQWRLNIRLHHAQYDGWSWDLLLADISSILQSRTPAKHLNFKAVSRNAHCLTKSGAEKSLRYWADKLSGFQPSLFPNLSANPEPSTDSQLLSHISSVPLQSLYRAAESVETHPQSIVLAALSLLLQHYLGSKDICIGTVASGRTISLPGIETAVGPCITTMPLRVQLCKVQNVKQLLAGIRQQATTLLANSQIPLADVKKASGIAPGDQLFDVLVVWQQTLQDLSDLDERVSPISSRDYLENRLLLELEPQAEQLIVRATFQADWISKQHVEIFIRQLDDLTTQVINALRAEQESPISSLACTHELSIYNPKPWHLTTSQRLSVHVEHWARRDPARLALSVAHKLDMEGFEKNDITYATLNDKANQVAHELLRRNLEPDSMVIVAAGKGLELYASILGVVKAGAAFIGVAPDTPAERVSLILDQMQSSVILVSKSAQQTIPVQTTAQLIQIENVFEESGAVDDPELPFNEDALAFSIFTSGTTGVPKGVLITQGNLTSTLDALSQTLPRPRDNARMLQACSQTFDMFVFEVFWSWKQGMCVCTAPKDIVYRDLEQTIRAFQVTHLDMTPTVASLVRPENVPSVEVLMTAGEAMNQTVWRHWAGKGLYQGYGPSETTIVNAAHRTTSQSQANFLGKVFDNSSAFVIDCDDGGFKILPCGAIGEFCFGGDQVFRGYHQNDDLNQSKIIQHDTYGRLYRSGDIGRMLCDGSLLITGRIDDQVKIRGQRVELGEINTNILGVDHVDSCSTHVFQAQSTDRQELVSFWVPKHGKSQEFRLLDAEDTTVKAIEQISIYLQDRLPTYMCPDVLVPVSCLPQTSQSKIDKRRLKDTYDGLQAAFKAAVSSSSTIDSDDNLDHDWSQLEIGIAEALSTVCSVSRSDMSRSTSLFNYGIDSVSAIALAKSLRTKLAGRQVDVSTIMRNMSIRRLARALLMKSDQAPSSRSLPSLCQVFDEATYAKLKHTYGEEAAILPCTPLQEALLVGDASSESDGYYNKTIFSLQGDSEMMKSAWESMVSRHEILRTCFATTQNRDYPFAQVVLAQVELDWHEVLVDDLDAARLTDKLSEGAAKALDGRSPPFSVKVFSSAKDSKKALGLLMHHAMYDGVALSILYKEIQQHMKQEKLDTPAKLEPFLAHVLSQDLESSDKFWQKQLDNFTPAAFPDLTGKTLPARRLLRGSSVTQHYISIPLHQIMSSCRAKGTSLLGLCQASWAKVLAMYLGESDLCFGNVVSGRSADADGIGELVAPCFNTIPIRIALNQEMQNDNLVKTLQQINADSLPYAMAPLRRLQAQFTSGQRLFDTLFILQQGSSELDDSIWNIDANFGEMDFTVVVEFAPDEKVDALKLSLHCKRATVLESDVDILLETIDAALASCINEHSEKAAHVNRIDSRFQSVSNADATAVPTTNGLLQDAVQRCSRTIPDAIALDFLEEDGKHSIWTFSQLNKEAEKVARELQRRGVTTGEPMPICLAKSPAYYASVLGVLKAGAAFTPFDPSIPAERKAFMITELKARLLISDGTVDTSWTNATVVNVTALSPSDEAVECPAQPADIAYRLYTSGSTGQPKAVSVEHRNAVQTIEASKNLFRWNSKSRLLQFASITFDMCYYDCFMAWSYGFALCAAPQLSMFNDLPGTIKSLGVNMLDLTPSVASSLKKESVPSVDYLYCIGEAMPQSLVDSWVGKCVNSYGPTEAAMCVTIFPVDTQTKSSVIGEPFENTSFHVLQPGTLEVIPVFGIGELCIGGAQLAREYHENKALTEKAFIFWNGKRLYRTGDLVRKLANGQFEFLGRADDQVKIRGLRVELGEISSAIRKSSKLVEDVTTQVLTTASSTREQIVSFLVISRNNQPDHSAFKKDIQAFLSGQLPSYMVPTAMLIIEKLPLSAAGKADRRALTKIFQDAGESVSHVSDEHEANVKLPSHIASVCEVLAELASVSVEQITPSTTIFQLGFDSISAVQIAAALKQRGLVTTAGKIILSPTVEGISATVAKQSEQVDSNTELEQPRFDFSAFDRKHRNELCKKLQISPASLAKVRPCSPLQSGMLTQFLNSNGEEYFNRITLQLPQNFSSDRLLEAWDLIIEKHEMLRTGFASIDDREHPMVMVTYRARKARVPVEFSSEFPVVDWHARESKEILRSLHEQAWGALVCQDTSRSSLTISMHHALFDASSMDIVLEDLVLAYEDNQCSPTHARIEPALERMICLDKSLEKEAQSFWQDVGKGALINHFPDLTPTISSDAGFAVSELSSSSTLADLQEACKEKGVTMQSAGQAAWAQILAAYTGESVVTFGSVLSGRMDEEAENVAFPCITTMPIVAETADDPRSLLHGLMKHNTAVHRYQHVPLTKIQRWMGLGEVGFFDTLFAYQKRGSKSSAERWQVVDEQATAEYPLSIELFPSVDDRLHYQITYRKDRVPEDQARLILTQLDYALSTLLQDRKTDTKHDDALYAIQPAKHEMLSSEAELLHEFVELGAQKHPGKVAFEFYDIIGDQQDDQRSWTYKQLDQEGNRVANFLRAQGIAQATIVAVCFDKCPEASFAMLGILKAGCGFLALDPGAPAARKKFITEDSEASAVLTMSAQAQAFADVTSCPVFALDKEPIQDASCDACQLDRPIQSSDTSYCLYTSGTTGTPKGCDLSHNNAVQALMAFQNLFKWTSEARWLQFASFHFDVSVLEQYWTWSVGITLVSAPRDVILEDLTGAIRNLGITHIDLTPSLARLVDPEEVPSLCHSTSVFITGGEALKQEIIGKWGSYETIYNGYGPTEATIGCTMFPRVPANGKPSNIGPQFLNVGSFVLKPGTDKPVFRGAQGELCVSGPLVAKGYLNRPDLTAERFPVIEVNGVETRIYRTGDLVRILHDGTFAFLGRADDQVKLRGQRLEIGEINAVEKESSALVQEVSTLVLKHPKQQREQLVSFIATQDPQESRRAEPQVLQSSVSVAVVTAREACQSKLPGYMVPTHFIPMNRLPLSPNNKIDGKQLKAIYEAIDVEALQKLSGSNESSNNEWTDTNRKIAEVLAKHLGIDAAEISKSSSIFELGLDSISNIGFTRLLRSVGFAAATTSTVMKNSTIGRLSKALGDQGERKPPQDDGTIRTAKQNITAFEHRYKNTAARKLEVKLADIEYVAPCTPLQQGLISRALESDRSIYFAQFRFELLPHVQIDLLKKACEEAVTQNSILRTAFIATDDGHAQVALLQKPLCWTEATVQSEEDAYQKLHEDQQEWWLSNREDIANPLRIGTVRCGDKTYLELNLFHALYDGSSLPLLTDAVLKGYHGSESVNYGPPFRDVLPHGPLRTPSGTAEFWLQHLEAASPSAFEGMKPLLDRTAADDSLTTGTFTDAAGLEKARRSLNTTHQALVQACWAAVLQEFFNAPLSLGMVVSGRSIEYPDAHLTIGPLFNTIPFYLGCDPDMTWQQAVERSHEFNTAALPYQHTPLREIKKWCRQLPQYNGAELFENLFVFQKAEPMDTSEQIWTPIDDSFEADYPLAFEAQQIEDGRLNVAVVAQAHMSSPEVSKRMIDKFIAALSALIADPSATVGCTLEIQAGLPPPESAASQSHVDGNGHGKVQKASDFRWDDHSSLIRYEVASLANVPLDEVDATTSILELGLDSIDAIKLSSRLKRSAGLQVPVSQIMQTLTVASLANATASSKANGDTQQSSTIDLAKEEKDLRKILDQAGVDVSNAEKVLPLAPLQEAMLAQMLESEWKEYFNHDVLRFSDGINLDRLKAAWQQVFDYNQILRTSFTEIHGRDLAVNYAQIVHEAAPISWHTKRAGIEDVNSVLDSIRREAMSSTTVKQPPFHLALLQPAETDKPTHLIISIAHALYDGWALGLIHRSVQDAYHGCLEAKPSFEPVLQDILTVARDPAAEDYWRDTLAGLQPALLQTVDPPEEPELFRTEHDSKLDTEEVTRFCRDQGITLNALCQTAYSLLLANLTKKLDVAFGVVMSGRDSDDANNVVFPTMNTIAFRSVVHGSRREMAKYVQQNMNAMKPFEKFPLRKAMALAHGSQALSSSGAMFDSVFIFQRKPDGPQTDDKSPLYTSVQSSSNIEYPLAMEVEHVNEKLTWRNACKSNVFSAEDSERLLWQVDDLVSRIIDEPNAPALVFNGDQVSICGLDLFEEAHTAEEPADEPSNETDENPELSEAIRQALSEVAHVSAADVSTTTTMFNLGLDSISAIKVSSTLRKRGIKLTVSEMLKSGTVAKMSRVAQTRAASSSAEDTLDTSGLITRTINQIRVSSLLEEHGFKQDSNESILPATAGQVYMMSMHQIYSLFYPTFTYEVSGYVTLNRIRQAWHQLVKEQPLLRTDLIATGSKALPFVQIVHRANEGSVQEVDDDESLAGPVDLSTRFVQLRIRDERPFGVKLALQIHHALYDGVSLTMLTDRLGQLATSLDTSADVSPHSSFPEYIASSLTQSSVSESKAFWSKYLSGLSGGTKSTEEAISTARVELYSPKLTPSIALERTAKKRNIPLQSLLLAAYAKLYSQSPSKSEGDDICVGIYLANRASSNAQIHGLEHLCAPTVNLVPLRVRAPQKSELFAIAEQIAADLRDIQEGSRSSVGLWELDVRVGTWVNFLSLPSADSQDSSRSTSSTENRVTIALEKRANRGDSGYAHVVDSIEQSTNERERSEAVKKLAADNPIKDKYLPSVDLEVAVREGHVDVGLFCPESVLGLEKAKTLVQELKTSLEALGGDE